MDISILTVHAAAMYWAYLFSQLEKNIFPVRKKDFPRHKKSLRLEAIGDNGHPAGLITIFLLALAKVRRKSETAKKKARNFRRICMEYVLEHKIGVIWGGEGIKRNKKAPDASRTEGSEIFTKIPT